MANKIKITGSDPGTGKLTLTKDGDNRACRKDRVKWKIKSGSGVKKIAGIVTKSDPDHIWEKEPWPERNHWKGIIRRDAPDEAEYIYGIHWIPVGSTEVKFHDPKITIQPDNTFLLKLVMAVMSALLAIFAVKFFISRKR